MKKRLSLSMSLLLNLGLIFGSMQADPVSAAADYRVRLELLRARKKVLMGVEGHTLVVLEDAAVVVEHAALPAPARAQSAPSSSSATPSTPAPTISTTPAETAPEDEYTLAASDSAVIYTAFASGLTNMALSNFSFARMLLPCDWTGFFATSFGLLNHSQVCLSAALVGWDYKPAVGVRIKFDKKTKKFVKREGQYVVETFSTGYHKKFNKTRALRFVASHYLTKFLYGEFIEGVQKATGALGYPVNIRYPFPLSCEPVSFGELGVMNTVKTVVTDALKIEGENYFNSWIVSPIKRALRWALTNPVMDTIFGQTS